MRTESDRIVCPFGRFLPGNGAFQKLIDSGTDILDIPDAEASAILRNHIVPGRPLYSDRIASGSVNTLGGTQIPITVSNGTVTAGGVPILTPDILICNGVVSCLRSHFPWLARPTDPFSSHPRCTFSTTHLPIW
jgi:uncharacterized surface protein with fasciclin (FAS1) repeats